MSVTAAELVLYNSATMPVSGSGVTGGAIDLLRRPDFTQMASNDTITVVSSNVGDTTQTVTITGRLADGSLASETLSLNGTTPVVSSNTYQRLLKAELSATCAGTGTVERSTGPVTVRVIPAGERGFQACFQQGSSSTGGTTNYYVKVFFKNTDASTALTAAVVKESANPSGDVSFGLAASLNDSASAASWTTAPAGIVFATTPVNVPNSQNLSPTAAIGVWLNLALAANAAALESSVTLELDGQTT